MNTLPIRFVLTASLARLVNEGLGLALVLLALDRTGSTIAAGWLVAASTLPQLVTGPLLGQVLDRSRRPWRSLRLAAGTAAGATVLMAVTLGRAPLALALTGALVMACVEPLLYGGISAIGGRGPLAASVYAWDSLAYNVAGLAGPGLVTLVAIAASPAWAVAALGVACGGTALTSIGLTADRPDAPPALTTRAGIGTAVRLTIERPSLRAATLSTTLAFAALGGLPFALVAATAALGRSASDAGTVLTIGAVGGLVGSLALTRRTVPVDPVAAVLWGLAAFGALLCLMGTGNWLLVLAAGFGSGLADAAILVALFTTRTENSPIELRATVFTVGASAKLGAGSIGAVAAGMLLDGRATTAGLLAVGAVHLLAAVAGWVALHR